MRSWPTDGAMVLSAIYIHVQSWGISNLYFAAGWSAILNKFPSIIRFVEYINRGRTNRVCNELHVGLVESINVTLLYFLYTKLLTLIAVSRVHVQ